MSLSSPATVSTEYDLCQVDSANQITELLRQRFLDDLCFTTIGCSALVAVNPYRQQQPLSAETSAHYQNVIQANTLIDLFGNAKTTINDNASRLAKYLQLGFSDRGRLISAQWFAPYALEKSRVTSSTERNFHVFYALLLGSPREEKVRLQLLDQPFNYLFMRPGATTNTASITANTATTDEDAEAQYQQLRLALKALGFSKPKVAQIFQVLAAILHLGNIQFVQDPNHMQDAAVVRSLEPLDMAAELLGVEASALQNALTYKSKLIKRDITTLFLDAEHASKQRDDLAEALYVLLFSWIIDQMNGKLDKGTEAAATIGLWDMPGHAQTTLPFDAFTHHFVAERMHQWMMISTVQQQPLQQQQPEEASINTMLDVYSHPAKGVFSALNAPQQRSSWVEHWASANKKTETHQFTVQHFWGPATYTPDSFQSRNEDYLYSDFYSLFRGSAYCEPASNSLVAALFAEQRGDHRVLSAQYGIKPTSAPPSNAAAGGEKPASALTTPAGAAPPTVTEQLMDGMAELTAALANTTPWFVLCMRPNDLGLPNSCDARKINQQQTSLQVPLIAQRMRKYYDTTFTLEEFVESLEKSESKKSKMAGQDNSSMPPPEFAGSDIFSQHSGSEYVHETKAAYYNEASRQRDEDEEEEPPVSGNRRKWLFVVWLLTWWIPSPCLSYCGGMKRKDIRMAWREKVALCILISLMCLAMILFIIGFGPLICPHQDVYSVSELQSKSDKKSAYVAVRGEVFDLTKFAPHHWASEVIPDKVVFDYAGKDATNLFPVQVSALCDGTTGSVNDQVVLDFQYNLTDKNAAYHDFRYFTDDYRPDWYFEQMVYMRKNYRLGFMGYDPDDILKQATNIVTVGEIQTHRQWAILHGDVYDLTYYLMGGRAPRAPKGQQALANLDINFMDNGIVELFRQLAGTDISKHFDALPLDPALRSRQMVCLRNLFFVGKLDTRRSIQCQFSEYFLLIITGILVAVIVFKFIAALQLGARREPEEHDKFIVCQVPCYTEGEESLRKTINSIAVLDYDDKRKLMFLVCDGMIVGSGNDRPTPRIVLDILGVDPNVDPEPLSFFSLGPGYKQHNMAKIYSGLYECSGHVVPYVVVVKVGNQSERQKPGNRGKRDSQMVLMRFLNKVHFDTPMAPMELEIYHQIKNVIGVDPSMYEFVLMVDADTEVVADSLNRMVSCFVHDAKIVGLCGETKLNNERDSWVTMIQVYEYYISHFLAKAFESLFGSVTCLPGCFCMYRVRSPTKNQPLLVSNQVIDDYAQNRVITLHEKNLLHLGEDRYLTTLILKHFPTYKTKFTADASCSTNAPEQWSVLLSQRRRWINSTVHNLGELSFLPQLCGFCCFSMRFVVILDLMSTLTMPAVVLYLTYLIYRLVSDADQVPLISILLLCGVYGLQALIFIIRRKWEHIGWMIIYILAIPLFSFFVPIYSFWHFDDFSWGNTRVVIDQGNGQKKAVPVDEGHFDPRSIPMKKWSEHEQEMWETGTVETKHTGSTAAAGVPKYPPTIHQHPMAAPPRMSSFTLDNQSIRYNSSGMLNASPSSIYSEPFGPPPIGGGPTDEEIRREVHRITATSDLMVMTKKQVREQLSRQFGVDMAYKKDYINFCIEEALHF
ncbi:chitin synthase-domain-containing protein [Zychaea mexicana]|uniref:chitin synthase-domain-containing protein n=1 Tax=Zychaea mexicana TaxID=64656 RepID=UPI0022FEBB92|nr:chitin synthase-domain-containing protein [Zychaea mexicana]KAI9496030.1 chitin synthase-domain-containing protein [Zychaea mexicana]